MKKIYVVFMLLLLCVGCTGRSNDMAVDFTAASEQGIGFTTSNVYGLPDRSIAVWVYMDAVSTPEKWIAGAFSDDNNDETFGILIGNASGVITYAENFTTQEGVWRTASSVLTTGLHHIVVTYDKNPVNDPVLYLDGVATSMPETQTPSGTTPANAYKFFIGAPDIASRVSIDGRVYDVKIYNRILTAAEILEMYNSRMKIVNDKGLVFHATMDGAAGLSKFDGTTLAAGNTLVDRIGGAIGVPAGNPVGVADNVLTLGGQ